MKKKIIIAVIVVALLASIITVVSLVGNNGKEKAEETEAIYAPDLSKISVFNVDTISEMEKYVAENELVLQKSDDKTLFGVGDIGIADQSVNLFIQTDANGSFVRVDGDCRVPMDEVSVEELNSKIDTINYVITNIFNVSNFDYNIYSSDGALIRLTTEEPLEKVINENAGIGISVIDTDDTYWNFYAYLDDDALQIEFFHSYQKDLYKFESANIVLN